MPAYLKGFEEQRNEIKAIINNPKEPTFENTIKPLNTVDSFLLKSAGYLVHSILPIPMIHCRKSIRNFLLSYQSTETILV